MQKLCLCLTKQNSIKIYKQLRYGSIHMMEVSSQLHTLAALTQVPIGLEAERAPELVWTPWKKEIPLAPARDQSPVFQSPSSKPVIIAMELSQLFLFCQFALKQKFPGIWFTCGFLLYFTKTVPVSMRYASPSFMQPPPPFPVFFSVTVPSASFRSSSILVPGTKTLLLLSDVWPSTWLRGRPWPSTLPVSLHVTNTEVVTQMAGVSTSNLNTL